MNRYVGPVPIPDAPAPWQTRTEIFPYFYSDGSHLVVESGGRSRAVFADFAAAVAHAKSLGHEYRQVVGGGWDTGPRPTRPADVTDGP